ncbi:hypothetical protein DP116_02230 [Brasilonema bromeliae SPC951]|uniref:Uncharacterized protein n=1 Tax=Brasilonema bromeliae SPC951 TaxID=385972 RepID=A0ABX1P222_9CYAN|nr:hypothetical protein [Brasilonema bromeliae SPC951]
MIATHVGWVEARNPTPTMPVNVGFRSALTDTFFNGGNPRTEVSSPTYTSVAFCPQIGISLVVLWRSALRAAAFAQRPLRG